MAKIGMVPITIDPVFVSQSKDNLALEVRNTLCEILDAEPVSKIRLMHQKTKASAKSPSP